MKRKELSKIIRGEKTIKIENSKVFDFTKGIFNTYDFKVKELIYYILSLEICPKNSCIKEARKFKEETFIKRYWDEFIIENEETKLTVRFTKQPYHQLIYLFCEVEDLIYRAKIRYFKESGFNIVSIRIVGNKRKEIKILKTDHPTISIFTEDFLTVINWNSYPYDKNEEYIIDKELINNIFRLDCDDIFFIMNWLRSMDNNLKAEIANKKDEDGYEEKIILSNRGIRYVYKNKHLHLEISSSGWKLKSYAKEYTDKSAQGLSEDILELIKEKMSKLDTLKTAV